MCIDLRMIGGTMSGGVVMSHGLRLIAAGGAVMLAGCGEIFDLTRVSLPPDSAIPDVPFDGADELGFSMAQMVAMVNADNASDGDPTLTSDMTEIYFKSTRTAGGLGLEDIWYSTRATANDPWEAPKRSTLATTDYDNQPRIAPNGLTIWFRRGGGAGAKLMMSTRAMAKMDSLWSAPVQLTAFDATSPPGAEDAAFMTTSPDVGYLMSKRTAGLRIFRSTWQTTTWGPPSPVAELVGPGSYDRSPWVTPDQLTIVFDSDRLGCGGNVDLWLARRPTPSASFGEPICLSEVNTASEEAAPWISPDLRHIYFRSTATGAGDIWEAHR